MEIKKKYLTGLLALALLIGVVSGAFIVRYTWQTNMSMKLVVSYELQLQYLNGTAISSYDWGEFSPTEMKSLYCQLNYTGNVAANVTWNTIDFPSGWFMYEEVGVTGWPEGSYRQMSPGEVLPIIFRLHVLGTAVPDQLETFTLNFTAVEYTP